MTVPPSPAAPPLQLQHCSACGAWLSPRRLACPHCGAAGLHERPARGTGTVWAVTTVHRAPTDAWAAHAPYPLVLVQLDEGPRLMGQAPAGLVIGQRVQAEGCEVDGVALLRFVPLAPAEG